MGVIVSEFVRLRTRLLQSAACLMALTVFATQAKADDAAPPTDLETVTVTGEAYALEKSLANKENASVVSDGISADDIGTIPEFGLGDALRQVPGMVLQINNGRGEDEFLTVRGLNPDYNTITVDGMQLPSTEETTRAVSLDVLPSVLVSAVNVYKTWTVDQPTDAIGGVTDLTTRSAFDNPGEHFVAHLDAAYWEDGEKVHSWLPSGQGDLTYSNTWGNDFGFVFLGSYYQRSSSTLNTYTLGYSYYPYAGKGTAANVAPLDQTSPTATSTTLTPSQSVAGLVPIPDRHRWYWYDNDRTRPGAFTRFDFDDHSMFKAHIEGGVFEFTNDENRYSQYLNRVGDATITSDTTGSFATGSPEVDYDKYVQYRQLDYIDVGGSVDFSDNQRVEVTAVYGVGQYKQTTDEDQFTAPTSNTYGFTYNLSAPQSALFIPNNEAAFMNPTNYTQVYHLNAVDTSMSHLPEVKAEYINNMDSDSTGLGFKAGWYWRDLSQFYYYNQYRLNPKTGDAPSLATVGTIGTNVPLYDGEGQTLLLINPIAAQGYVNANPSLYTENSSDQLSNTVNNYHLSEMINALYAEAQYKWEGIYALAGLRYENTAANISNYLPVPFTSTTNFQQSATPNHYARLLPSLNLSYDVSDTLKLRGAVTQNLARPEYSQEAENSSASIAASDTMATETVANPNLKPREATNFDLSAEYYPAPGVATSLALFDKQIHNEIITTTTTLQNTTIPGFATPVALTIVTPSNVDKAEVDGVEAALSDVKFDFLPDFLSDFGGLMNASWLSEDTPYLRMSDGSYRKLPALLSSSKFVGNVSLLYNHEAFSGQVAYNYTSKMPISFDTNNAANDQWWAGIGTLDAQVMYKLNDNIFFRIQGKNLLDGRPQKVVGTDQQLNYSALENGRNYYVGVGVAF
jgi:TonB-dependent receptor